MSRDDFEAWADEVRADLIPKLHASAAFAQMVPPDVDPDVKMAVELGMALLLDKPLILIVVPGRRVPDHLVRAADAVIEWDGENPDVGARVAEAMHRIAGGVS